MVALRPIAFTLKNVERRLGRRDYRRRGEVEGNTENVRVFDVEQTLPI